MSLENRLSRARLTALPARAGRLDYQRAWDDLVHHLQDLPGVVAIYRTGGVSAPGISDLDAIAVVERGVRLPDVWPRLAPRTRDLAMHSPLLIDAGLFARHRQFAYVEPLELIAGEPIDVDPRELREYSEPLIAAEGIMTTLLRLVKQAVALRVKVRSTLCALHSLHYDLELGRLTASAAPAAWVTANEVRRIRAAWFESGPATILPLVHDALPALQQALAALPEIEATAPQRVALGGPWRNVQLLAASVPAVRARRMRAASTASAWGRSARGAELAWRFGRCTIELPRHVIGLLAGRPTGEYANFRRERERLLEDYREFMTSCGPTYSMLGMANLIAKPGAR